MAAKKNTSAMDFIVAQLKKNPQVEYAIVKQGAVKRNLTIYPIMYGRAKALLGLVPMAPRGSKKKAAARKAAARKTAGRGPGRPPKKFGVRRGPGRPRKQASPLDALQGMVAEMRQVERERDRYRRLLTQIGALLERGV